MKLIDFCLWTSGALSLIILIGLDSFAWALSNLGLMWGITYLNNKLTQKNEKKI